ncbi:hypothetical protein BH10PSE18_BH10PSE18_08640 [soil metagenome]
MKKTLLLVVPIVAVAVTSCISLANEKQIADARIACGQYVARRLGPSGSLEATSQWPATDRTPDTWLVQANYSLRGRYDAMWCQMRVLGSQFGLARIDTQYEDSRRAP